MRKITLYNTWICSVFFVTDIYSMELFNSQEIGIMAMMYIVISSFIIWLTGLSND